jgi:8-oxo-dGTP pyrophosphatase MutT (NUDIX family)
MDFEPEKLFIGLTDFFAILLPGALLTYVIDALGLGRALIGSRYTNLTGPAGWVAFFFASYLFGHFIFLLGSWLLDDYVYDKIRDATSWRQIRRLVSEDRNEKRKKVFPALATWLADFLIKKDKDSNHALTQALRIKDKYLGRLNFPSGINAFQWCRARLNLEHPEAAAAVERFDAASKFFRSLIVVLCLLVLLGLALFFLPLFPVAIPNLKAPYWRGLAIALVSLVLLCLAFWRYVDQRVKATNQAYWYIITLEGVGTNALLPPQLPQPEPRISRAGGVVYRKGDTGPEYLLVQASRAPNEWVLPKGHIEPGETMQETAVREVREETGVWARMGPRLEPIQYIVDDEAVTVQFYLMRSVEEGKASEKREHQWFQLAEALQKASHSQTRELLQEADRRMKTAAD